MSSSTNVIQHRLGLNEENNPNYYEIFNEYNSLMDRWNILNKKLFKINQPKIFLFRQKKNFNVIAEDLKPLQNDFLKWYGKAQNFAYKPHYIFTDDQERELGVTHFTNILFNLRSGFNQSMLMIVENFVKVQLRHTNQKNFNIAIVALIISSFGLFITAFPNLFSDLFNLVKSFFLILKEWLF